MGGGGRGWDSQKWINFCRLHVQYLLCTCFIEVVFDIFRVGVGASLFLRREWNVVLFFFEVLISFLGIHLFSLQFAFCLSGQCISFLMKLLDVSAMCTSFNGIIFHYNKTAPALQEKTFARPYFHTSLLASFFLMSWGSCVSEIRGLISPTICSSCFGVIHFEQLMRVFVEEVNSSFISLFILYGFVDIPVPWQFRLIFRTLI